MPTLFTSTNPAIWRRLGDVYDESQGRPSITTREPVDPDRIGLILTLHTADMSKHPDVEPSFLEGFQEMKNCKPGSLLTVYAQKDYSKYAPDTYKGATSFGRSIAKASRKPYMRGQRMLRPVRNTLFSPTHVDLDMRGCFPSIASQIFDYLPIPTLKAYVADPDLYRTSFPDLPPWVVKKAVNNMLAGSGPAGAFLHGERKKYGVVIQRTEFFRDIYHEARLIQKETSKLYPGLCELMARKYSDEGVDKNAEAGALCFLLQDVEDTLTRTMYGHLVKEFGERAMQDTILCFDGLMVNRGIIKDPTTTCSALEEAVFEETGLTIKMVVKAPGDEIYADCLPKQGAAATKMVTSYSEWKEGFDKCNYKLKSPLCFVHVLSDGKRDFYKRDAFTQLHEDTPGASQHLERWLGDSDKRSYEREDFYPHPLVPKPNHLNSFHGFAAESSMDQGADDAELIRPILNHIKLLTGMSKVNYEYLLDYLAQMVQYPGKLPGVALCFRSREGVGKDGLFDEFIGGKIIGTKDHYTSVTNLNDIHGDKHSLRMLDKLLVIISEASREDCKAHAKKFNDMCTKPQWSFRPLYVSELIRNNCIRVVMFSQDEQFVIADGNARRVVIFDCSGAYANVAEYHNMIHAAYDDERVAQAFFRFLKGRDIADFNANRDKPKTERSQNVAQFNTSPVVRFMMALVSELSVPIPGGVAPAQVSIGWKDITGRWDAWVRDQYQGPAVETMTKKGFLKSKFTSIVHDSEYVNSDGQATRAIEETARPRNVPVYSIIVAPLMRFLNKAAGGDAGAVMDSHDVQLDWGANGAPAWVKDVHASHTTAPSDMEVGDDSDEDRGLVLVETALKGVFTMKK